MSHDAPPTALSALTDPDCLITFAAIVLSSDNAVRHHEMGYSTGGGISYITAHGVMRRTGLSRAAAERALHRLQSAGMTETNTKGDGWRTNTNTLTTLMTSPDTNQAL
jgi:hypothetical protein